MELNNLKDDRQRDVQVEIDGDGYFDWKSIFIKLRNMAAPNDGSVQVSKLRGYVAENDSIRVIRYTGLSKRRFLFLIDQLESKADRNNDGKITVEEWESFIQKHQSSFMNKSRAGDVLRVFAFSPTYSCSPPTLFLLLMTLLQIIFFFISIHAPQALGISYEFGELEWPTDSFFIYDPHKREQAWRFLTYMFLHGNIEHITFNCIMQLAVGIPLEMSQVGLMGSFRVGWLYMSGVLLGILGASVTDPNKYVIGASAGVYALISAHLATLILNWKEDGEIYKVQSKDQKSFSQVLNPIIRIFRLGFVLIFTCVDVGFAIYAVYFSGQSTTTSYMGHFFGFIAGLLIGVCVLENRKIEPWEKTLRFVSHLAYAITLIVLVAFHIFDSDRFPEQVV